MITKTDLELLSGLLEETNFPICFSRKNISEKGIRAFVLGKVNYRGQKFLNYRTKGPSRYNKKFNSLYKFLRYFIKKYKPFFNYTTIQLNKNVLSPPHIDKNNVGTSYIIALGDYSGGNLVIEGKEINIKNKLYKFDGTKAHWITPFTGTRYSLVFFTHTFKPPHPYHKFLKITKNGIYKKGKLIKKY